MTPRQFHFWSMVIWCTLGAGLCLVWKNSLFWVIFMSWYAIVVTHATGWGAGRAEQEAKSDNNSS